MKYKQLLLIEDGSVDVEKIENDLAKSQIYIIVYRQGANIPQVVNLYDEVNCASAIGFEISEEQTEE